MAFDSGRKDLVVTQIFVIFSLGIIDFTSYLFYMGACIAMRVKRRRGPNRFRQYPPVDLDSWTDYEVHSDVKHSFAFGEQIFVEYFHCSTSRSIFELQEGEDISGGTLEEWTMEDELALAVSRLYHESMNVVK